MVTGFLSIAGQWFSSREWLCSSGNSKSERRDWVVRTGGQWILKSLSEWTPESPTSHNAQHPSPPRTRSHLVSIGVLLRSPDLTEGCAPQSHQQLHRWENEPGSWETLGKKSKLLIHHCLNRSRIILLQYPQMFPYFSINSIKQFKNVILGSLLVDVAALLQPVARSSSFCGSFAAS